MIEISECKFTLCHSNIGSALYLNSSDQNPTSFRLVIGNSNFSSNTASDRDDRFGYAHGGAVAISSYEVHNARIDITHCLFHNNTAYNGKGGAISTLSNVLANSLALHVRNSTFTENSAWMGGAISAYGVGYSNQVFTSGTLGIEHSHFEANSATSGGVVFASQYNVALDTNNVFVLNSAITSGGVAFVSNSLISFSGSNVIERNHAKLFGGALYLEEHSKLLVGPGDHVTNIRNNSAGKKGGAIYVDQNEINVMRDPGYRNDGCFIQNSQDNSLNRLVFEANRVSMSLGNVKACLGNDIYSRSLVHCSLGSSLNETLGMFEGKGIILKQPYCSLSTDPSRIDFSFRPMCNITIKDVGHRRIELEKDCEEEGHVNIDTNVYSSYFSHISNRMEGNWADIGGMRTFGLVFPGYNSKFRLDLLDEFNQTTISGISLKYFQGANESIEFITTHITPSHTWLPAVEYTFTFAVESLGPVFVGQMCASVISPHIATHTHCINLIVSACPTWNFTPSKIRNAPPRLYVCTPRFEQTQIMNHDTPTREANDYTHVQSNPYKSQLFSFGVFNRFKIVKCEFFNCKCNSWRIPPEECRFNLLTPYDQCKQGLTGPFCTKCSGKKQLPIPPVSIMRAKHGNECYTCWSPYIGIPLFFLLAIVVSAVILSLRIDIFNDYTRSIAFYSSILYLYIIGCGQIGTDWLFQIVSVFLSISNLLITQNYPFCISNRENTIQTKRVAIFNEWSPFVFYLYLGVVYLLFNNVSCLQRYNLGKNIHFPMWTLFILSYCNLCVGAFVPFQCNSVNKWIYDSTEECNQLGPFYFSSIALVVILFLIPLALVALSYRSRLTFVHLTRNYEERFRDGYKLWEVMKLFCRFIFTIIFLLPYMLQNPDQPINVCFFLSPLCLILLILNSIFQPATNPHANHFESYCLFVLAIVGIPAAPEMDSWINYLPSLLVLSPYVLFLSIKLVPILKFSSKLFRKKENIQNNL